MPMLYESKVGQIRYITSKSLKAKLITFTSNEYDKENVKLYEADTDDLLTFFEKIGINAPKVLTFESIERMIEEKFKEYLEEIPVILTMERVHFMAIIYILNENLATIDEVIKVINMPFYTRTEYLLRYLSRENENMIRHNDIFKHFYYKIENLVDNGFEKEDIQNVGSGNVLYSSININSFEKDLYAKTMVNSFDATGLLKTTLYEPQYYNAWQNGLLKYEDGSKMDYLDEDQVNDSFMEIMDYASWQNATSNTYNSYEFIRPYFEDIMSKRLRKSFLDRANYNAKQSDSLYKKTYVETGHASNPSYNVINLTDSLNTETQTLYIHALDPDSSTEYFRYGIYLREAYNNTNNYFTSASGTLNTAQLSLGDASFDYINNTESGRVIKRFAKRIFPSIVEASPSSSQSVRYHQLDSERYFTEYFLNSISFGGVDVPSEYQRVMKDRKLDNTNRNIPEILENINMVVYNNSITIGGNEYYKLRYINPKYIQKFNEILLQVIDENNIIIPDLDAADIGWAIGASPVSTYLTDLLNLEVDLRAEIEVVDDYETSISLSFYVDMFVNYINYLLGTDGYLETQVTYVSDESYKNYRFINYIQQTFVAVDIFYKELIKLKYYDLYLLFFSLHDTDMETGYYGTTGGRYYFYNYSLNKHRIRQQIRDVL